MAIKRLGRGLDALFGGDEALDFLNNPGTDKQAAHIPLSKIEPSEEQPRKNFEKQALSELAESIKLHGVITPIAVRRVEDGYRIIAGERRWRAARLAGLKEIPAVVLDAGEQQAMEMALIENLQREDLNPIEEARGYEFLLSRYSLTQEEVAERVGKSRPTVANALRLLNLPAGIIKMLNEGKLSGGHARALAAIPGEKDKLKAAQRVVEEDLSVRQTERLAKALAKPKTSSQTAKPAEIAYIPAVENDLTQKFRRKVRVLQTGDKGKIELEYYSEDDLKLLIDLLGSLHI